MAEILERELAVYGFAPLVWVILVTIESEKFMSLGIDKAQLIMNPFWIGFILLILGVSGLLRRNFRIERFAASFSIALGFFGLFFIGVIGYALSLLGMG